ncbi:amidohydrolase 3 [Amniculicola lignicola CBS 123094]|uniref:Amidohydrolase 3 n=1 Tax=Amniculicola lignicola CBS 123094 TaxID=1392246 RepID=A0A6A5WX59_9PLEO|nr:amidohydrolase 3 [Amniculicola lignicola CBS 123094]
MPAFSPTALTWYGILALLVAVVYQQGPAAILDKVLPDTGLFIKIIQNAFSDTHCYVSITTLDSNLPHAECFSVAGGKFTRVFLDDTSFAVIKEKRTGHVIPGLWDGHGHLLQYGELLDSVDLFGAANMDEVKSKIVEYKRNHEEAGTKEQWLRGVGWDQAKFKGKWPVASDLEINKEFKDQYVMLDRIDVHCVWVSNKVLSLLPSPLPKVEGGEIPAKGVFCDNAMDIVMKYYPKPSNQRKAKFVKDAIWELNKVGVVGMHDAGVLPEDIKLYQELVKDEDWSLRVYAMLECETRNTFCPTDASKFSERNGKLDVQSVKLFADGALGSWGSAMIEPYNDKKSSTGSLLINATALTKLTQQWARAGYQVNIHAIGDLANKLAVEAFTAAYPLLCPDLTPKECQAKHRFRIEHAQIIHPETLRIMADIGIIPSIQPTHATSDMHYAESRLGHKRMEEEAYLMRSLLPLRPILGSDFPVEPANPFAGIYAAVTRRSPQTGLDANGGTTGFIPGETITLEDALEGFTRNAAHGAFSEGRVGSIEKGAWADWVVLDESIETIGEEEIRKLTVKETWIGGKQVYHRAGPIPMPYRMFEGPGDFRKKNVEEP